MKPDRLCPVAMFLIALSVFAIDHARGQNFGVEHYTAKDKLVYSHVDKILADKEGYLWFATRYGLSRYNGYEFVNHSHDPQDPCSFGLTTVKDMFLDEGQVLWAAGNGLCRYDYNEQRFVEIPLAQEYFFHKIVGRDEQGRLWLSASEGLLAYSPNKDVLEQVKSSKMRLGKGSVLAMDARRRIWLGNQKGVECYQIQTEGLGLHRLFRWKADEFEWGEPEFAVYDFFWKDLDELWVSTSYGIHVLRQGENPVLFDAVPELDARQGPAMYVNDVERDSEGNIWVTQGRNLLMMDPQHSEVSKKHTFQSGGLKYFWLGKMLLTEPNTCWVASQAGAYKVTQQFFEALGPNRWSYKSLFNRQFYGIWEDPSGKIWAASKEGLVQIVPRGGKWDNLEAVELFPVRDLSFVEPGAEGEIYWGSYKDAKVYTMEASGTSQSLLNATWPDSLRRMLRGLKAFHLREDGTFWMGTRKGLWIWTGGDSLPRRLEDGAALGLDKRVLAFQPDRDGKHLWLGAGPQLVKVDMDARKVVERHPPKPQCARPRACEIDALLQDEEGLLWVGTNGSGLACFQPDRKAWLGSWGERDNLASNQVRALLPDDAGNIWVATDKGISYINARERQPRSYFPKDGLPLEEFNIGAACKLRRGELLFGGRNGILRFDPRQVIRQKADTPALLAIDQVRINSEPASRIEPASLTTERTLTIAPDEEFFEICYAALHFQNQENFSYEYRLEGFDEAWKTTRGNDRVAKYMNVPPGEYHFAVKLVDVWGQDLGVEEGLKVVVQARFLERFWVKVAAILLAVALGGTLLWLYVRQLSVRKKEEQMRRERSEAIMQALRSQMNPHFIYNSLNSINNYISSNDVEGANRYLVDFAGLMRLILKHSKNDFISLEEELETLRLYLGLERLRLGEQLSYSLQIDPDIPLNETEIPPLLIQPFVENAIWHGLQHKAGRGKLLISFSKENRSLKCRIQDDGIGRKRAGEMYARFGNKPQGVSTDNIQRRIQTINQMKRMAVSAVVKDLVLPSGLPSGTLVELSFSLH